MNAIILAAGKSSKMKKDGYECPKPLLPILRLPNIERTILMLREFGIQEVFIVCGNDNFDVKLSISVDRFISRIRGGLAGSG